jgi:hypothetical protein
VPQIRAVPVNGVRSQPASDGQTCLFHFRRLSPDPSGSHELNLAAPVPLLPYIAAAALQAIPQPEPGAGATQPFVMEARAVQLGLSPAGAIVLTVEMELGARISFSIDLQQAETLQQTVSIALGRRRAQALRAEAAARSRPQP